MINVAFYLFWIAFYLKILLVSLFELKLFKDLLSSKDKETGLSRLLIAFSRCLSQKNKNINSGNQGKKLLNFNFQNDKTFNLFEKK
jgi:hypothetical protein